MLNKNFDIHEEGFSRTSADISFNKVSINSVISNLLLYDLSIKLCVNIL